MSWFSLQHLQHLISSYGYSAMGAIVCLESIGIPLPGETVLVLAALYAGTHHDLNIFGIVASAAAGAILGDNVAYWIGRQFGYGLLLHYGPDVGLSDRRIKLGQYLFLRHGRTAVFFCRFIGIFGALVAFLAGANRMPWRKFLVANAAGGIVWASGFGLVGYLFGEALLRLTGPLAAGFLIVDAILVVVAWLFIRAHEAELQAQAERAFPGPLRRVRRIEEQPRL